MIGKRPEGLHRVLPVPPRSMSKILFVFHSTLIEAVLSISPTADGPFRLPTSSKSSVTGKHLARWKATSPTADHSAAQRYQAATMASFTPTTVPKETLRYPAGHSVA
ncbi:hypothetical protein QIS74_07056 [Colletotrichum tabaci]|uniref:Uncharacterized protein n=1 Tax=Colletotrichum tabaci TaxID=1209068 RepID=A0AAV9TAM2_9PEZI